MTTVELGRGSILGTRVERVEDPVFLTRGATYTEDVVDERLQSAVRVTFVRATIAHARIVSIDTSAAEATEGCVAVFTADDLTDLPAQTPVMPSYPRAMSQPLLSAETVRYVGEPVAAVVHDSRDTGEDIAELVAVDYEPLPVIVDPQVALDAQTVLFPELGTNVGLSSHPAPDEDIFVTARSSSPRRS
jgi:aerobic carbon-monoxide dehydrogenase large subunit